MLQRMFVVIFAACSLSGGAHAQQTSLDHVAIYVKDVQVSADFYKDVFGVSELPVPFRNPPVPVKWLDLGHGQALHVVGGRKEPLTQSKWDHLALASGDMDRTIARLDAKHIVWTSMDGKKSPQVRPDGVKQIFIQDPDGYWIEINDRAK